MAKESMKAREVKRAKLVVRHYRVMISQKQAETPGKHEGRWTSGLWKKLKP